jgi:hypothetical protein
MMGEKGVESCEGSSSMRGFKKRWVLKGRREIF